jgi:hypothetical protein
MPRNRDNTETNKVLQSHNQKLQQDPAYRDRYQKAMADHRSSATGTPTGTPAQQLDSQFSQTVTGDSQQMAAGAYPLRTIPSTGTRMKAFNSR